MIITPRSLCGSGWGVPGGSSGKLGAMQHYHRWPSSPATRSTISTTGWWRRRTLWTGTEPSGRRSAPREPPASPSPTPPRCRATPWEPGSGGRARDIIGNARKSRRAGVIECPAIDCARNIEIGGRDGRLIAQSTSEPIWIVEEKARISKKYVLPK